uniref:Uncharacterized protein n=1 Tax=viral metagenome TaxID=1070528 RepID=A0A6C0EH32_9ZZZZ
MDDQRAFINNEEIPENIYYNDNLLFYIIMVFLIILILIFFIYMFYLI